MKKKGVVVAVLWIAQKYRVFGARKSRKLRQFGQWCNSSPTQGIGILKSGIRQAK